jgi:hypothetical protein
MVGDRTLQDAHRYGGVEIPTSGFTHFAEGIGEPKTPSHGENRGSSPLGSANKINNLSENVKMFLSNRIYAQLLPDKRG